MADWNVSLPDEAVEGADTHVEDHNAIVAAVREVRENVDDIELTPGPAGEDGEKGDKGDDGERGPAGSDAENPFTEDEVAALKALVSDED